MRIVSKLNTLLRKPAYKEISEYANKHVKIDWDLPTDSYSKIYEAKDTIANYAKSHKADIKIYDGMKLLPESHTVSDVKALTDTIVIEASTKKSPTEAYLMSINENPEKPFIRNVYEAIQDLFHEESPIKQHIKNARERLSNYYK